MKKTCNIILIILAIFLFIFTVAMAVLFYFKEAIPDTLVTCVFAACTGELSVMGWIKTAKTKYKEMQEEKEELEDEGEIDE